jgi:hypothetical protein
MLSASVCCPFAILTYLENDKLERTVRLQKHFALNCRKNAMKTSEILEVAFGKQRMGKT